MNKHCTKDNLGSFSTFHEASEECSRVQNCTMFYDGGGKGTRFYLCGSPATVHNSPVNSILYTKEGKSALALYIYIYIYIIKSKTDKLYRWHRLVIIHQIFVGCCNAIYINSDTKSSLNGVWTSHFNFNGRPVYKRNAYFMFYTDTDGPNRWIVERTLGKTRNEHENIVHGYIRYEGDVSCPEYAGARWSQWWNKYVVDSSLTVTCGR